MDKALRYLSLAMKAGKICIGLEDCIELLQRKKGKLVIYASDAGDNTARRVRTAAERCGIPVMEVIFTRTQLALAIGRGSGVAVLAFTDAGLAAAFSKAVETGKQQEEPI